MTPMGIGVLPLILLLAWVAISVLSVRIYSRKKALLANSGVFAACGCLTAVVALANPFGKSLNQLFLSFLFLFLALQSLVFDCFANTKQKSQIILSGRVLSLAGLGVLAIGAVWWSVATWNDKEARLALKQDRQTVADINATIAQAMPKSVLVPIMGSGFPSVLELFARVRDREGYTPVIYTTPYQWPDSGFVKNPELAAAVRREISRFGLIMIVRGGSKLHPGLGTYLERAYGLMEDVVDDPAVGFTLLYRQVLPKTTQSNVYFFRERDDMIIEIFGRKG